MMITSQASERLVWCDFIGGESEGSLRLVRFCFCFLQATKPRTPTRTIGGRSTREEAIYAEDMTAVDADIAQLQRERLADIRRQAVLMQQMAASCAHEDVRALAG